MAPATGSCLVVERLSVHYGATVALDDVGVEFCRGELHALMGANGSGKSTLIKVLAGVAAPRPGAALTVDGSPVPFGSLSAGRAGRAGLYFVHQDRAWSPSCRSSTTSTSTSRTRRSGGRSRSRRRLRPAWAACSAVGLDVDPGALVETLSDGQRVLVALARIADRVRPAAASSSSTSRPLRWANGSRPSCSGSRAEPSWTGAAASSW